MIKVLSDWTTLFKSNWKEALSEKGYGTKYAFNLVICVCAYLIVTRFIIYNRLREGAVLNDPVFSMFRPVDFSVYIFVALYTSIFLFLFHAIPKPKTMFYMYRGFLAVFVIRGLFIFILPLSPPTDTILLTDPFVDNIIGFKKGVANDLFFSGHIADLSFFAFCCTSRPIRAYLIAASVLVAAMLVAQKVHYTADVLAAPFFSYISYIVFVKDKQSLYPPMANGNWFL